MILSRELVQAVTGDADRWHGPLEAALRRWQITTPTRVAMFLAQCGHESGGYRLVVESLRYSADAILRTWPNRFSADDAKAMAHDEQRIAERAYGGRMGNGPE
ncbi:MAG: glycoside hydrolase family 19 protein, partial [Burkholderiales bacterium]|nr:glycoside hydrolase family 19 protein [Burkholderiales bacterium]